MRTVPIRAERIRRDIEAIAACTGTPGAGASRPTFSPHWRAALDHVADQLRRHGCKVRTDAAGNLHARPEGISWEEPVWLSGSHLDTVPHGGDFDGVVGVVVPLEILRAASEAGITDLPLELIVFAEEEGTTFGLGMLGSHAWVGNLSGEELDGVVNDVGESYVRAGASHGVRPEELSAELLRTSEVRGMIEVHIEQGAGLWRSGAPLAVVTAIAGRRQYRARIRGVANHAGSTAMVDRRDALAGAAEVVLELEALAGELSSATVITVGQLSCHPGAVNVIPGEVELSIDFRSPEPTLLEEGHARIEALIEAIAGRRGLTATLELTESLPVQPLDAGLCRMLGAAAARAGLGEPPTTASGALHDAAILAPHIPAAMLFVASRDGISHNPEEHSRVEDIAAAATLLWEMLTHER